METPATPAKERRNDTIAAIATGSGGGIGIVRISGPGAGEIATRILRGRGGHELALARPFLLTRRTIVDPESGEPIDEGLAVFMPAARSYTGEATVEVHAHGGGLVLDSVLQAALKAGARLAQPGEFTRRAYLCGRLDLSQAEAVAQLIGAESESMRRDALHLLRGAVGREISRLRESVLDLVVRVEAALDFDEEEAPSDVPTGATIASLAEEITGLAERAGAAARGHSGIRVALAGRTNSGKSSIFNYLLDMERSIVTSVPGTTRDYIEERSVIDGVSLTLIDTAGVRTTDDVVETEGIRRGLQRIEEADVVVLVFDGSEPNHPDDQRLLESVSHRLPLIVVGKSDLPRRLDAAKFVLQAPNPVTFGLSTVTGEGFSGFTVALAERCRAARRAGAAAELPLNARHRDAIRRSAGFLKAAAGLTDEGNRFLDRVAIELRASLTAMGEITGETATEEILDRVFSRFCVGK